jgi:hypothetical protein
MIARMKRFFLAAVLLVAANALAAWTPPPNADAQAILHSALDDRIAKRYDDALRKHLWFRTKGAKGPMAGVRNTFALGWFAELAEAHPPAKKALLKLRDEAEAKVRKGEDLESAFADYAAINRELDDPLKTASTFMQLEKRSPDQARLVSRAAMDALVEARYYELAAKYVVPRRDLAAAADTYRRMVQRPPPGSTDELASLNERFFATASARIVALLAVAGRTQEANEIAEAALGVSASPQVRDLVDKAKQGQVPPPFISREDRQRMRAGLVPQ